MLYQCIKLLKSTIDTIALEQLSLTEREFNTLCKDTIYRENLLLEIKDIQIVIRTLSEGLVRDEV